MKVVRRELANGQVKEYRYRRGAGAGSVGALILEYQTSAAFKKLAPSTRKTYLRALGYMEPLYASAITEIKRRHILRIRDKRQDTPALANQIAHVASVLFGFAVEMEYRESNPAHRIKPLKGGHHRRWSDDAIRFACETLPERFRRAIVLALYTGQREGDVIDMKWSAYDGTGVNVVQIKTGAKLWIPCDSILKAELDSWRQHRTAVTILTDSRGRPWRIDTFATQFSAEMRKHQEMSGLVFHGLRMTAAAKLAEAGCSAKQIAAITGHRTLAMVQRYTNEAEQRTLAKAAIVRLENARKTVPQDIEGTGKR